MKKFVTLISIFFLILPFKGFPQTSVPFPISTDRLLFHDNVDKQQKRLAPNDEGMVKLTSDEIVNMHISNALIKRVDEIQEEIEKDTLANTNIKKKYLRTLEAMVKGFNDNWNKKDFSASIAPDLIKAYEKCLELDKKNESIKPIIVENQYPVGKILIDCFRYPSENPGVPSSRIELTRKYLGLHPDEILPTLRNNPNLYFADSLIKIAAHRDIRKVYDYAASRTALAERIRNHPDTLIRTIGKMAISKSGQLYFPFLDNLLRGKISFEEIDRVKDNDFEYYRLMVSTRIEYAGRLLPPNVDTATELKALTDMMARKAKQYFIREINALHSVNDENVRFKRLEGLTPQELYYLAVLGEDEIYTSSFVKGVYPRIFQRMPNPRGDSLLLSVNGDYFRKFIKMCAGYNTLNDFLGKMDKDNANTLMKAFVIGLERAKTTEDAVDVADSYSSIIDKNPELGKNILNEVKWNYEKNRRSENKRGTVIYNILKVLFESADSTKKINLSKELGIPPIYSVDLNSLKDDSGRIVMQVFFYGDEDKDGQHSFVSFMSMFRGKADWKIAENSEWVSITNTKMKTLSIYANKPLLGEDDPEEKAISNLAEFLENKKIKPSIFVHRGHSYHVQSTMRRIQPSARIVILGSCGGYNNINEVLSISHDAHIISSKQTGTMHVNEPILQSINSTLTSSKNIDWLGMWKDLGQRFTTGSSKEMFDDYIPPYKNLGAIFIKAYRKEIDEQ